MSKRENKDLSEDAKKKQCLDTTGQSLSVDTEREHLFLNKESTDASTETVSGNPTLDTDDLDILDTQALARWDRENQGSLEAEYSYGGEADLHGQYMLCTKNPGHKNFIPVDKFSIEDLPEGYRDPVIVEYIRALSDLTVRVKVRYVSDRRPVTVPGSDQPYLGFANRGQMKITVGTGWVEYVNIYRNVEGKTCECKECRNSLTPETHFVEIAISTAKHIVFDELEAEHTTCHLFYDTGGTPNTCNGVVVLTGMKSSQSYIEKDQCLMKHYTHDLDLGHRIQDTRTRRYDLRCKLWKTLPEVTQYKRSLDVADKQPLMFIVSHPHGCSKQISIGHWTSVYLPETGKITFEYTTATCPGCSGAAVFMPHTYSQGNIMVETTHPSASHCGTSESQKGVNYYKGLYDEIRMLNGNMFTDDEIRALNTDIVEEYTNLRLDMGSGRHYPILGAPKEDNFCCVDEEDQHRNDDTCHETASP